MKGPYERLKYDLRRLWECPRCGRRERTGGEITFCVCRGCADETEHRAMMKLVEDGIRRINGRSMAARSTGAV